MGHIIVPIGLTNGNHLPTQFFTVFRPQGEGRSFLVPGMKLGQAFGGVSVNGDTKRNLSRTRF
jgi:hypothetical protein